MFFPIIAWPHCGHAMTSPDMRTLAQQKARLRPPRKRRDIMSAYASIIRWPHCGHLMASPDMRTFAQQKARLRSPRERRDIMSAYASIISFFPKAGLKILDVFQHMVTWLVTVYRVPVNSNNGYCSS